MTGGDGGVDERGGRLDGRGVLVIGAGVSGLTTAYCLRQEGAAVTVLADRFAPRVTSVVAGALWEWPPAVCGHHRDPGSLERSKRWCAESLAVFTNLAANPSTGVHLRPANFYFHEPVAQNSQQLAKMHELAGHVRRFRHDAALIQAHGIGPGLGLRDAYTHLAPMIDTDVYMRWLLDECRRLGCRIVEGPVAGLRNAEADKLARRFEAEIVVNCAGLGAREFGDAAVYPLRGALVRVRNDGRARPRITEAHCVSRVAPNMGPGFLFVVPRGEDWLVLGGLAEPDAWGLDVGLDNHEPIRAMYRRCVEFLPALRDAEIDAAEPVRVGLRPARLGGVRLEIEPGTRIVHNYGHGGSGVTFSWGCAREVVELIASRLVGSPPALERAKRVLPARPRDRTARPLG
jgi:D-amino-acid oxidase